jgi:hypothetical protein
MRSGDQMFVPEWMLDAHRCHGMEVREHPGLTVSALLELRESADISDRTHGSFKSIFSRMCIL